VKYRKPKLKRDRVLRGDLFVVLPTLPRNSIDGIVTDPPYGISFGNHADWDAPIKHGYAVAKAEYEFQREGRSYQQWCAAWARECWRVLRPGGYLLAFSSRRLLHRMMAGIEDAGFEPRDIIAWRYKSGLPTGIMAAVAVDRARGCFKREAFSHKVYHARSRQGRAWDGWHTGLKPGFEPILVMRKPFSEKTLGHNLLRWGVGAFHVDACRTPLTEEQAERVAAGKKRPPTRHLSASWNRMILYGATTADRGAWPVNVYTCSKPSAQERDRGLDDARFTKHGRKIYAVTPHDGEKRLVTTRLNVHPCLHPDALVLTELGYRPIGEIETNERVYGADGRFHPVTATTRHPYTSKYLYEIAVHGTNLTTLASDNHLFLVWRPTRDGKRITGGKVLWLRADAISTGDYTMTPVLKPAADVGIRITAELEFRAANTHLPANSKRRQPSRPTLIKYRGTEYTLRYVKAVQRRAYVGDVVNLSVQGSPTFQTMVGMSHNTVKPVRLLRWLLRLVLPTKREMRRGVVLDPFAGSGSTGVAAVEEGFHYVMVERKRRYARIASARIAAARLDPQHGRERAKPKAIAKPAKLLSQMPRLFSP
jgi:DNA modification methylase